MIYSLASAEQIFNYCSPLLGKKQIRGQQRIASI
jgi:hypothetical protein